MLKDIQQGSTYRGAHRNAALLSVRHRFCSGHEEPEELGYGLPRGLAILAWDMWNVSQLGPESQARGRPRPFGAERGRCRRASQGCHRSLLF